MVSLKRKERRRKTEDVVCWILNWTIFFNIVCVVFKTTSVCFFSHLVVILGSNFRFEIKPSSNLVQNKHDNGSGAECRCVSPCVVWQHVWCLWLRMRYFDCLRLCGIYRQQPETIISICDLFKTSRILAFWSTSASTTLFVTLVFMYWYMLTEQSRLEPWDRKQRWVWDMWPLGLVGVPHAAAVLQPLPRWSRNQVSLFWFNVSQIHI